MYDSLMQGVAHERWHDLIAEAEVARTRTSVRNARRGAERRSAGREAAAARQARARARAT